MIAHSHDDLGWKKSYNDYYTGFRGKDSQSSVEVILTEVVRELLKDPKKLFTYVEMKFFNMWYTRQSLEMRNDVKKLVKNGQFEITMGGWSATDESDTNYEDIIGNFYQGHQWIKEEFDVTPRVGWNIDSYGHTETNTALFHDLGFEALFFAKIAWDDIQNRFDSRNQASHFLWRPQHQHFGNQKQILAGLLQLNQNYGFQNELGCCGAPDYDPKDGLIQDDPTLDNYNVEIKTT